MGAISEAGPSVATTTGKSGLRGAIMEPATRVMVITTDREPR